MKGFVEHLIASSNKMERELSKDYDEKHFSEQKAILCVGIGENTFPIISWLENLGIRQTVFTNLLWESDSITDSCEILAMNDYEVSAWNMDGQIKLPFISVFMIDFTEDANIEKAIHFINETHMTFPYTNIVVMSIIPSKGNRTVAIEKCNKLSKVSETIFVVDEKRISTKYPSSDDKTLHIKSLSFMASQFKDFAEMILVTGNVNIDWYDIFNFVAKTETECNKAIYFTSSGNNPEEILDTLKQEMSHYNLDNVIIDIISSDDSLSCEAIKCIQTIDSFDFIWGIRKSKSLKKSVLKINVFAHKK
ncbi:hypothetical protein [Phocaeicola coprocola]|uniref:hypothetical protein n=1 Tax=Phocaeicola coprocola TaxID=310298 RepID=UPI0026714776|nr:hypothetical protein [Phocaeicola coprocola]